MTMPDPRPQTRPAPAGGPRYAQSMTDPRHYNYSAAGAVAVGAGKARFVNDTGVSVLLSNVSVHAGTAPTGAALIVDVNRNGTTVFTDQTKRPQLAAGATDGSSVPALAGGAQAVLAPNDVVTIDVDQVGSTVAGSDLTVVVDVIEVATGGINWTTLRDGYVPPVLRNAEQLPVDANPGQAPVELGVL